MSQKLLKLYHLSLHHTCINTNILHYAKNLTVNHIILCICLTVSDSTNVTVVTLNEQIVGQPLMLECEMSTPRGIDSRVDIVWTRDGVEVEHVNDISSNFSSPEVVVYTIIYTIQLLGTYDDDVVYECEVIINSSPLHIISENITLHVTGMCALIYLSI